MKPRQRQLAFVLASLCVVAALAAVTMQSLRLERNELRSRAIAEHEASVRLVLWRMDSMLAPILAREAATPYYYYRPFFEASRTIEPSRDLASIAAKSRSAPTDIGDALIPSPLLQSDSKLINLYFEVDHGRVRSPQAPEGADRKLAESNFLSAYRIETNLDRVNRLESMWNRSQGGGDEPPKVAAESAAGAQPLGSADQVGTAPGAPTQSAATTPANAASGDRSASAESTPPPQVAQQQLNNDYAQRAQVAMNSKLTQLEAERSASQWRRGEDEVKKDTSASDTDDNTKSDGETPEDAKGMSPEEQDPAAADADSQADPMLERRSLLDEAGRGMRNDTGRHPDDKAERYLGAAAPPSPPPAPITGARDSEAETGSVVDLGAAVELDAERAMRGSGSAPRDPIQGPLEPRWLTGSDEPTLVLVRQVTTSSGPVTQGLWLNWPELRGALLELASDVFPSAAIDPLPGGVANLPPDALNRCLATIPAELRVPEPSIPTPRVFTPVRVALSLAWIVALGAIAASGLALRSATELADRRGQFVSAVTHELRTPLTTFCLYSQMLADGMVRDADAQAQYHSTLHRESQRLTRIVESVLEYARLGKRKAHAKPEATSVGALLDASLPALRERSQGCGLELVDTREGDMGSAIRVDRGTFDRILSNLVDNACKYAAGSDPARVELTASVTPSSLEVRVRDFGPGIPASEAKRIFDPFFRGSAHSDGATPGLGLGLALCKALAREMGGDLSLIQPTTGSGACFRLVLPRNA